MIMVSACLLGINCKYNGEDNYSPELAEFLASRPHILVCPETLGSLPVPRPACEIAGGTGTEVLAGQARVLTRDGNDVTDSFIRGARVCLELARLNAVDLAILKKRSPSCGSNVIYDGTFAGRLIDGDGVTAALLKENGIEVRTEEDFGKQVNE